MRKILRRRLEALLEMSMSNVQNAKYKLIIIWQKLTNKLINETTIAEESGKSHEHTQEWVYLGIRKDGKELNRGHALMHIITYGNAL